MKRPGLSGRAALAAIASLLAACPAEDRLVLWLAPAGSEVEVRLSPVEPDPF